MKNTTILTAAALLVAGTAFANAETITLPANSVFTWVPGSNASVSEDERIGKGASSAEIIQRFASYLNEQSIDSIGWFGGTGQSHDQNSQYGTDISISASDAFTFKSRPALSGEYVALGLNLDKAAESISLDFTSDNKLGYSLWSYDSASATATELLANTYVDGAKTVSARYDAANVNAGQLFVVWTGNHPSGNAAGNTSINVSGISLSYVAAAIPEPSAFGLLAGLGALALAGTRRRRKA